MRGHSVLGLALLVVAPLQGQQPTRSPHGDLAAGCNVCHSADGWTPVRIARGFDHAKFGFGLDGAHGTASCRACHRALDFKGVRADCVSCHTDKHRGELGASCAACHTTRSFLDRDKVTAAHRLTRFPLEGGHLGVDCSACHTPSAQGTLQFVATPVECVSCHRSNYEAAPNHVANNFPTACAGCHSQVAWNRVTGMSGGHPSSPIALSGVHGASQCTDCHLAGQPYSAVQQTCDGCHHADFVATRDPDHVAAAFSTTCTSCHGLVAGWTGATYAHPTAPLDPAQGAHGAVTCAQCHTTAPYSSVRTTCDGCHHADYVATANPNHAAAGYPNDCAMCHRIVAGWAGANVNHPTSPIALTGVHGGTQCTDCHLAGQPYSAVPQTCDGCHHTDFVATRDPDHVAAAFSTTCTSCHGLVAGWAGATYVHATTPIDPRQGAHGAVTCAQCHTAAPYSSVRTTCDGCHHADYVATTNPSHAAAGYSTDCAFCHQVVAGWAGANVNHPTSPIALTGVHGASQCTDCHLAGQPYSAVQRTCDGCHHTDFVSARDPDHVAAGFSTTCTNCHGLVAAWAGATYVHATTPIDPKQGAHGAVTCAQCHTTAPYSSVRTTCDGCHHADYVATTNPNHTAAGYSTDCAFCHQVVAAWTGASVNHPTSPIALTGVHGASQCSDCHLAGQPYSAVQRTCDGCHHTDFVSARDPDHVAAGFSTTCTNCHGLVAAWAGATYVHATTPIDPKQGAHGAITCAQCHTTSPYSSVPTTCDGCHHPDYVATTNPSHTAAGIPTTCADCHRIVAGWTGATYSSHPSTPLALSGQHAIPPRVCGDCHITPTYAGVATTCDGCHHTTYIGVTDPNHTAIGMQQFAAANCPNCHSPTKADWNGPTWTHKTIVNPRSLRLPHQGASCADCHQTANNYTLWSCAKSGCHSNVNGPR